VKLGRPPHGHPSIASPGYARHRRDAAQERAAISVDVVMHVVKPSAQPDLSFLKERCEAFVLYESRLFIVLEPIKNLGKAMGLERAIVHALEHDEESRVGAERVTFT
jgi:hypothetical protein